MRAEWARRWRICQSEDNADALWMRVMSMSGDAATGDGTMRRVSETRSGTSARVNTDWTQGTQGPKAADVYVLRPVALGRHGKGGLAEEGAVLTSSKRRPRGAAWVMRV